MILFVAGDAWTWNVSVRYADAEGTLLDDRERWVTHVERDGTLVVERTFLGTVVGNGELIPSSDPKPERLKGTVEPDGTIRVKDSLSDPVAARVLRRLLNPARNAADRLTGFPLLRHALIQEPEARLPGSDIRASLRVEATMIQARLGGKDVLPAGRT